jgi:hypothetical protein
MLKKAWLSLLLLSILGVQAQQADHYWQWGWGSYGSGSIEDIARFDWSFVNFGNIADNEQTVAHLNEILRVNPNHRFVIRIWPILGIGKLRNNRYQATLWDYFYRPEVKERIRGKIRHQFELLHNGLSNPEAIIGMTYLEEVPQHFTSCPFKSKITQAFMPWDMAPFEKEIRAELGHPFDISKEENALWWGKKYCQYFNEMHQYIRSIAPPNCKILYWQATYYNTLNRTDKKLFENGVLPFHIEDLLKEGNCDGIFGYPNNDLIWQKQTMDIVQKHNCLFFSQVSTPAGMRLTGFSDTVERAMVKHPGNLGTFVYVGSDQNIHAWNMIPEFKGKTNVHIDDMLRWLGHRYQIGMPVVKQILKPRLYLEYDFRNKAPGDYATVSATLYNPRNKSWFGGNEDETTLKNVELELSGIPDDYVLPPEANSPRVLHIENLGGEEVIEATWWLQKEKESDSFSPKQLQVAAQADGVEKTVQSAEGMQQSRSMNTEHTVSRTGERWLMITSGSRKSQFHLELQSLRRPVSYPRLTINDQEIVYRDSLGRGDKLRLYPGVKATLLTSGENREIDVTNRLDGFLNLPANAVLTVTYDDRDEPNFWLAPLLRLKLVDSSEIQQTDKQRQGGGDF